MAISNEPEKDVSKKKSGFLLRSPAKINTNDLSDDDGNKGFYLPKKHRELIESSALDKTNQGFFQISESGDLTQIEAKDAISAEVPKFPKTVYINNNKTPAEAFVLGPLIGEGGFGKVCSAQNIKTGRWSCMKQSRQGKTLDAVEMDFLKKMGMYRSNEQRPDQDVLISELFYGQDLWDQLYGPNKSTNLSFEQQYALTLSLLESHETLQADGWVHRDIKPENVMVDLENLRCTVIDFGFVTKDAAMSKGLKGTPQYMPAEALSGQHKPSFSDDVYALGLVADSIFSAQEEQSTEKLNESTIPSIQDRRALVDETYTLARKKFYASAGSREDYGISSHVTLGSQDPEYMEKLSESQRATYKLIFDMTGKQEERPSLKNALGELRDIRIMHIKQSAGKISSEDKTYSEKLQNLLSFREKIIADHYKLSGKDADKYANENKVVDNMDAFMLRMVDSQKENRPTLQEIEKYQAGLEEILSNRTQMQEQIKMDFGSKGKPELRHVPEEEKNEYTKKNEKKEKEHNIPQNAVRVDLSKRTRIQEQIKMDFGAKGKPELRHVSEKEKNVYAKKKIGPTPRDVYNKMKPVIEEMIDEITKMTVDLGVVQSSAEKISQLFSEYRRLLEKEDKIKLNTLIKRCIADCISHVSLARQIELSNNKTTLQETVTKICCGSTSIVNFIKVLCDKYPAYSDWILSDDPSKIPAPKVSASGPPNSTPYQPSESEIEEQKKRGIKPE